MATRHNTCVNPALGVDVSGWGGGSTAVRTDVTSLGFARQWAARYTSSTFSQTGTGAVVAGQTYTLSMYVYGQTATPTLSGTIYIEWRDSGGGGAQYTSTGFSISSGTVERISITATAPSGAATASLITDGWNFGTVTSYFTMVLIEQAGALDTYFDGDSPSATWDGTAGLSASTLIDEQTIALSRAAETDTARPLTFSKTATISRAPETDTARALTVSKSLLVGRATETDSAQPVTVSKTILIGRATETSTARPLTLSKTLTLSRAAETDTARALVVSGGAPAGLGHLGGSLVNTGVLGGSLI